MDGEIDIQFGSYLQKKELKMVDREGSRLRLNVARLRRVAKEVHDHTETKDDILARRFVQYLEEVMEECDEFIHYSREEDDLD